MQENIVACLMRCTLQIGVGQVRRNVVVMQESSSGQSVQQSLVAIAIFGGTLSRGSGLQCQLELVVGLHNIAIAGKNARPM